jgi:hypothetical protein
MSWRHIQHQNKGVVKDPYAWLITWRRLIVEKNLTRGVMIHFNLAAQVPTITIVYLNFVGDDDDKEEDSTLEDTLFAQRCHLTDAGLYHLLDILPPFNTYIGVPFVTRLISTSVNKTLCYVSLNLYIFVYLMLCPCMHILWWGLSFDICFLLAY